MRKVLVPIVLIVLVTILTLVIAVALFEDRFIYYPTREIVSTPRVVYEDVDFEAADGTRLHGWFIPAPGRSVLIVSHGNAGNIGHRASMADFLHEELQVSVFLYDYRGYGRSEGTPSEDGTYADIRGAYARMQSLGYGARDIFLLGQSLGTAVSVDLAAELEVGGVILEAPFTSVAGVARSLFYVPLDWLLGTQYDSLEKIARVRAPIAIVHARDDPIVAFDLGSALFDAAPEPKRFFAVDGEVHEGATMALGLGRLRELKDFVFDSLDR